MAKRIGGRPYKTRLLPGVGYPIPISLPAAAASGGFASPLAPWPYALGVASAGAPFDLTPTAAAAFAATLTPAGALALGIQLSGAASLAGTFTASGALSLGLGLSGSAALAGSFSASGDTQYFGPFTTSGSVSLSGSLTPDGEFLSSIEFPVAGAAALSGSFSASGGVSYTIQFPLSGNVSLSGSFAADAEPAIAIALGGNVSLSGAITPDGEFSLGDPFDLDAPLDAAFAGAFSAAGALDVEVPAGSGFTSAVALWPFGFGAPAVGAPFETSGSVVLAGSFAADAEPVLLLELSGSASLAAAFSADAEPALSIGLAGSAALAGGFTADGEIQLETTYQTSGSVTLSGAFAADGEILAPAEFQLSGSVDLSGSFTAAGDVLATETPIIIPGVGFQDFAAAGGLDKPKRAERKPRLKAPKIEKRVEPKPIDFLLVPTSAVAMVGAFSVQGSQLVMEHVYPVRGLLRTTPDAAAYPRLTREHCSHCGAPVSAHQSPKRRSHE